MPSTFKAGRAGRRGKRRAVVGMLGSIFIIPRVFRNFILQNKSIFFRLPLCPYRRRGAAVSRARPAVLPVPISASRCRWPLLPGARVSPPRPAPSTDRTDHRAKAIPP